MAALEVAGAVVTVLWPTDAGGGRRGDGLPRLSLTRLTDLLGGRRVAAGVAVVTSSALFGLAHTEQGAVGVALATIGGVAFAVLRIRHDSVWAPVLAHGITNTAGLVSFFLVGPFYGLW